MDMVNGFDKTASFDFATLIEENRFDDPASRCISSKGIGDATNGDGCVLC